MAIKVGDKVLVSGGSSLLDAEVKETREADGDGPNQVLVHYLVEPDRADEWVARDRVLEDTQANRELQDTTKNQKRSDIPSPSAAFEKICGPNRLNAIAAWMNTVDVALVRLDNDVNNLIENQSKQAAQLMELERRKKEAIKEKVELETAILKDLKRIRVAEETAMARNRLQNAGVPQEEIDAILPVIPHAL